MRSSSKLLQKIKRRMPWLFDCLVNFYFIYFLLYVEELHFCFQFFSFNWFFFLSVMTNNQTKWGIIYEKISMRADDDERMINYELPQNIKASSILPKKRSLQKICFPAQIWRSYYVLIYVHGINPYFDIKFQISKGMLLFIKVYYCFHFSKN